MSDRTKRKILPAIFYRTAAGSEPVRDWLKSLSRDDKRIVGQDIATVEFGWPVGMPHCRSLAPRRGLWEVRSSLTGNRIGRVLFFIHEGQMVLLHGFIKKTQQTPDQELDLAVKRKKEIENDGKTKK
jgi:phage-related protein